MVFERIFEISFEKSTLLFIGILCFRQIEFKSAPIRIFAILRLQFGKSKTGD